MATTKTTKICNPQKFLALRYFHEAHQMLEKNASAGASAGACKLHTFPVEKPFNYIWSFEVTMFHVCDIFVVKRCQCVPTF